MFNKNSFYKLIKRKPNFGWVKHFYMFTHHAILSFSTIFSVYVTIYWIVEIEMNILKFYSEIGKRFSLILKYKVLFLLLFGIIIINIGSFALWLEGVFDLPVDTSIILLYLKVLLLKKWVLKVGFYIRGATKIQQLVLALQLV